MNQRTLLIVTDIFDPTADVVVAECNNRGVPVFRMHPREYPGSVTVTLEHRSGDIGGTITDGYRCVDLDDIGCAWYRRPERPQPREELDPDVQRYVVDQCENTLRALYTCLADRWIVNPLVLADAENKLRQLAVASALGLETPQTLITNHPDHAQRFRSGFPEGLITKPLMAPRNPIYVNSAYRRAGTVKWAGATTNEALSYSAAVYQPDVPKELELRCVVIGDRVWAASVASQTHPSRPQDVRSIGDEIPYQKYELPRDVARRLVQLTRSFEISFCSADVILTPDGRYVFLDLNPNGQWMWLCQPPTNLPLTDAFVDLIEQRLAHPEGSVA